MTQMQKIDQIRTHFRNAILKQREYPFGTIAYYGPDDHTVTKIVAGILLDQKTNPIVKIWHGEEVQADPQTITELGEFFQDGSVVKVIMAEGIIGCPHDEGVDYPSGESCPNCPFWSLEEPGI